MDQHFEREVRLLKKESFQAVADVFFVVVCETGDTDKWCRHGGKRVKPKGLLADFTFELFGKRVQICGNLPHEGGESKIDGGKDGCIHEQ